MGPAFTQSHIRTLAPIFTTKAEELGDKVVELARKGGHAVWTDAGPGQTPGKDTPAVLNMSELLDCASFDVIGKAGFGIDFDVRDWRFLRSAHRLIQICNSAFNMA